FLDHRGVVIPHVSTNDLMKAITTPERIQEHLKAPKTVKPPERDRVPVHLMDIHLEKGMHCVDCHFTQDNHGNTKLYGEVRAAIEIQCIDCHGTVSKYANLRTSGPAAPPAGDARTEAGHDLRTLRTPSGKRRFEREGNRYFQNSMVDPELRWVIVQTKD